MASRQHTTTRVTVTRKVAKSVEMEEKGVPCLLSVEGKLPGGTM
jgi:hypothetical protein